MLIQVLIVLLLLFNQDAVTERNVWLAVLVYASMCFVLCIPVSSLCVGCFVVYGLSVLKSY